MRSLCLRTVTLLGCVLLAFSRRLSFSLSEPEVNFEFMTDDMNYTGRSGRAIHKFSEWLWADRQEGTAKEEIVTGHTCQKAASSEDSYYASSFCYWVPEILTASWPKPMLRWQGGSYTSGATVIDGRSFPDSELRGKCIKASVCHNNGFGSDDEDAVTRTNPTAEAVPLPKGCLGENEILWKCEAGLQEANADLKKRVVSCGSVQERHTAAVHELNACLDVLRNLPSQIETGIPRKIRDQEALIRRQISDISRAESDKKSAKTTVSSRCLGFSIFSPPFCPHHLMQKEFYKYQRCKNCKNAHSQLSRAKRALSSAKSSHKHAESRLRSLHSDLRRAKERLNKCQGATPALTEAKKAMDDEWLPQKEGCYKADEEYQAKQKSFIPQCARSRYDDSCEKACIESQRAGRGGCGVVEGNKYGAAHVRGGMEVPCAPPQPSWIMGPARYAKREPMEAQCKRILSVQQPQFAQSIAKAGWLWRKVSAVYGWDKHFAVFESADAVRSAVLRFYEDDPSADANVSSSAPSIVLWDAKGVKAKEANHYGFKNGESCFKLYHFYVDYRFCVPSGEATDEASEERDRADWMNLLSSSMKFSDWK